MADFTKPVTLVSGAVIQNRGNATRDRFYTRVECNYSGIVGNLSANMIGQVAVAEAIDIIRERWGAGKTVSGDSHMVSGEGWQPEEGIEFYTSRRPVTHRRYIDAQVLKSGPGKDNCLIYQRNSSSGKVYTSLWDVSGQWFAAVRALYTMRRVFTHSIDGIKTRDRLKATFVPSPSAPAFASSGLMITSLRGAVERKRSYRLPVTAQRRSPVQVDVDAGFSLQVDAKRSGCAVGIAGLNEMGLLQLVNRQNCPKTADLMDHLIEIEERQDTIKSLVRAAQLAAQGMRWIGAL